MLSFMFIGSDVFNQYLLNISIMDNQGGFDTILLFWKPFFLHRTFQFCFLIQLIKTDLDVQWLMEYFSELFQLWYACK